MPFVKRGQEPPKRNERPEQHDEDCIVTLIEEAITRKQEEGKQHEQARTV